jgi:hypothetical protein
MPASATTVTSGSWWAVMKDSVTGSIVLVSAMSPSKAWTISGNPALVGQQPDRDLRFQAALLGEPAVAEPSPAWVSKYSVDTSYKTRLAGPRPACAAHAAAGLRRYDAVA